jgi:KAP family P-loop domain
VIVVLDDLDRLQKDELVATLRLMKLSAELPNVTYIAALDRTHIQQEVLEVGQARYLDKFIDMPLPVGALDVSDLISYFERESGAILARFSSRRLTGQAQLLDAYKEHASVVRTLRDVKRILSAFSLALELVRGEVNVRDVFFLELIRHLAPAVWVSLMEHEDYLVWLPNQYFRRSEPEWNDDRKKYYEEITKLAGSIVGQQVQRIVEGLFPFVRSDDVKQATPSLEDLAEQRACHYLYFPRYFLYRVLPSSMPDAVLDALIAQLNSDTTDPEDALDSALARSDVDAAQLFDRLIARSSEMQAQRRPTIAAAVATVAEKLPSEKGGFLEDSAQDRARAFIFALAATEQNGPGIQRILEAAIRATPSLVVASDMVHFSQREYNRIITDWTYVDLEALARVFDQRAYSELVGTGLDIIEAFPRLWPRITHQWRNTEAKSEYLRQLIRANPARLGDVLAPFYREQFRGLQGVGPLDLKRVAEDFDVGVLRELLLEVGDIEASTEEGRAALAAFRQATESDHANEASGEDDSTEP